MSQRTRRLAFSFLLASCSTAAALCAQSGTAPPEAPRPGERAFERTWHSGVAEIATYAGQIRRYGELRPLHTILVHVSEPFRTDLHVKAESGRGPTTTVLKLNRIDRFVTGIYDYSMMQSVFTPYDSDGARPTLKTTTSVQDWCGHTWLQTDRRDGEIAVVGHSYFEREGEERRSLPDDGALLLEDGVWTRIRIDPAGLPTGEVAVVPSTFHARLRHEPLAPRTATARWQPVAREDGGDAPEIAYELDFGDRVLTIRIERAWPCVIRSWSEIARGPDGREVALSEGRLVARERQPYWQQNGADQIDRRPPLGLHTKPGTAPTGTTEAGERDGED
jgi:hypothetical protein